MINSGLVHPPLPNGLYDLQDGRRQVKSIGRRTDLIRNHAQRLPLAGQVPDAFHKILSKRGVYPSGADGFRQGEVDFFYVDEREVEGFVNSRKKLELAAQLTIASGN